MQACTWQVLLGMLLLCKQGFSQTSSSPIWGNNNNSQVVIGYPLYNERTWGMLPSQLTLSSMPNRNGLSAITNNQPQPSQPRRLRRFDGRLILTDQQGNVVYDNQGNPAVDSSALGSASGSVNADADGSPPPPPDDPVDVPIDGGVGILLMIGIGAGYRHTRNARTKFA